MSTVSSPLLYVIVMVIVIALLFLAVWLLDIIARNRYYKRFVTPMLLPGQVSLSLADWGEISPPGLDGVMVCNGTAPLKGLPDKIQLSVKSKNKAAIEDFTENVKFQFSPIYEAPPTEVFQQLISYLGKSSDSNVEKDVILDDHDWLLEFGMQASGKDAGNKFFAVAFNIDPTITRKHAINTCPDDCTSNCNKKNKYTSTEKNINVKIKVSKGSIDANPGGTIKTGTSKNIPIPNPNGDTKSLTIGGREKDKNTYSLSGTWNCK